MNLIAVLIALAIIIVAFKFNVFLGIAVAIVAIGVGIYNFLPTYYAINGNKAFEIGDEDRAREWYKKACETGRANVKLKSSYAYVLLRTGYADEAEKVLDPIIRVKGLAPEKKNLAKQQRCMVYYKQGRLDEAIEDAQSMMNEGYRNSSIYGMLGYFKLLRNDDLDETTKLFLIYIISPIVFIIIPYKDLVSTNFKYRIGYIGFSEPFLFVRVYINTI